MTILKFRDLQKGGDGKGKGEDTTQQGQAVMSQEQLTQLLQAVGSMTQKQQGNTTPAAQNQTPANLLGLGDSELGQLSKAFGEEGAQILVTLLGSIKKGAEDTDALLLQELKTANKELLDKLDSQNETLTQMGSARQSDTMAALGLEKVFSEDNMEDLGEMMEILTERSGGFFNAKEEFDNAVEKNDVAKLLNFKEKFESFVEHKYKDHQSVPGGNSANNRTALEKRDTVEKEIDKLKAERDALMSGPNKDFRKAADLQEQIMQKAESLTN